MVSTYCLVSDRWYSFALQADSRSALGTRCNGIDDISVHRPDTDIPAQCCNTKGNRSIGKYIHVLTFKRIASGNKNFYQKISSRTSVSSRFSVTSDTNRLSIINSSRVALRYFVLSFEIYPVPGNPKGHFCAETPYRYRNNADGLTYCIMPNKAAGNMPLLLPFVPVSVDFGPAELSNSMMIYCGG